MHALRIWTLAARPKTLMASVSPVLIGTTMAFVEGFFSSSICVFTFFTALGLQVTTNLANDYFDFLKGADTAARKGPLRVTQSGLVSSSQMKIAIILSLSITALFGLFAVASAGTGMVFLLLLSLLLSILYTGGPYPLAYLGLGDLFVFLFFGPIAVAGTYFLQAGTLSWQPFLIGISTGLLSTAILIVNNLRDVEEDRFAHKKTMIVRLGTRFGRLEYLFCLGIAFLLPLAFLFSHPLTCLASLVCLPAIPCVRLLYRAREPWAFNLLLAQTGILLFLFAVIFSMGLILRVS